MADTENPGLCDETLDIFGEFMTMVEETLNLPSMDFDCSICMDLLHRPHQIEPCRHTFCESCLIRLSQAHRVNCPNCRGAINGTNLNHVLDEAIQNQHQDTYLRRRNVEMESGIFDVPMNWTPVADVEVFGPIEEADVIYMLFENDTVYLFIPQHD